MRLRDILELVRVPNVFTAPSDVAMGMALGGAAFEPRSGLLFAASALAYAGGMALNDACDATLDAKERPRRPIPSGRVDRLAAFGIGGALLLGALALASLVGLGPLLVCVALCLMIVLYDAVAKGTMLGPFAMASCRALNAGLGLATGALSLPGLCALTILFGYVLMLTVVSRFEVTRAPRLVVRGYAVSMGTLLAVTTGSLFIWFGAPAWTALVPLGLLAAWLSMPVRAALEDPSPKHVIGIVKASVLGIILLDAAFVTAGAGLVPGLAVASLFVPAYILGRRFASA